MIQYAAQKDRFRCGPYAILNALKWAGWDYSEKRHKKYLSRVARCGPTGTTSSNMWRGLVKLQNKFECIISHSNITLGELNKHLRYGGSAILDIYYYKRDKSKWNGHWIFIEGIGKRGYKVINYSSKSTISFVKPWNLKREMNNTIKQANFVACWLLRRWQ